jgi:hypothetical protein
MNRLLPPPSRNPQTNSAPPKPNPQAFDTEAPRATVPVSHGVTIGARSERSGGGWLVHVRALIVLDRIAPADHTPPPPLPEGPRLTDDLHRPLTHSHPLLATGPRFPLGPRQAGKALGGLRGPPFGSIHLYGVPGASGGSRGSRGGRRGRRRGAGPSSGLAAARPTAKGAAIDRPRCRQRGGRGRRPARGRPLRRRRRRRCRAAGSAAGGGARRGGAGGRHGAQLQAAVCGGGG